MISLATGLMKSYLIFRSLIDYKLKNQQSLFIINEQKNQREQNQKYPYDEPEENKISRNISSGFYTLKEKHTHYFSPRFVRDSLSAAEMINKYTIMRDNGIGKRNSILFYLKPEDSIEPKSVPELSKFKDWKLNHRYILSHGDFSINYSHITEKEFALSENYQKNTNKSETSLLNMCFTGPRQSYIMPNLALVVHAYENYSVYRFLSGLGSNYLLPNLAPEDQAQENCSDVPESKAKIDLTGMNKKPSLNLEITPHEVTLKSPEADIESVQLETQLNDLKLNNRYILSQGDNNYSHITEKGFAMFENCQENTIKPETNFIQWFLPGLNRPHIMPNLASGDHTNENCSTYRFLSGACQINKMPNLVPKNRVHENYFNVPESKDEADLSGFNTESLFNSELTLPEVATQSPETNSKSWSYAMDKMDDETYELISILEDDSNDIKEQPRDGLLSFREDFGRFREKFYNDNIKEQPRDGLLKGRFREKFGFEASNTLEEAFENANPLSQSPNERRKSIFNPRLNRSEFCSRFQTTDRSLDDEGYFLDPIYLDEDFNRQEDNSEVGDPVTLEKRRLGLVSFVKSLFHIKDRKDIRKFVKP